MPITTVDVVDCLRRMVDVIHENKGYLTDLDAAIGDADHGINMDRGFQKVLEKLPGLEGKDVGTVLKTVGMTLVSSVGGAGGPLYGTAFMQAGTAVAGKHELGAVDLLAVMDAALEGVMMRGRSKAGEKTMIDAIAPAVTAMREALENGASTQEILEQATAAARQGMKDTIPMQAFKGRASYLGERSIGHQDPGATSSFLLIRTMAETAGGKG
jgi:dihydroxyacetone kinase-like protein